MNHTELNNKLTQETGKIFAPADNWKYDKTSITDFIGGGYKKELGKGNRLILTKNQTFESFLQDKHMEDYHGLDDDAPDAYEGWLENLQIDDFIAYGQEYGKQEYELGLEQK